MPIIVLEFSKWEGVSPSTVAIFCRPRHRVSLTAIFLALLSIASVLIAPVVLSANSFPTKTAADTQKIDATSEISAAATSLESGQGPPALGVVNCSPTGLGSAFCETNPGILASSSSANPSWTNITASSGPAPSIGASMAYDTADSYVVLYTIGGSPGRFFGATWKFLGGVWTDITASGALSPGLLSLASMTYDAADGYVILFGGTQSTANYFGDTWKFLGGSWTLLTSSGPSPRYYASMVYDAADGYVLLFGGLSNSGDLGDTWKFLSGAWTNLAPTKSPSPRHGASMAYDAADGYAIMYGGGTSSSSGNLLLSDTWKFLGGSWTNISSSSATPRALASMAYDTADGYVILFGGEGNSGILGDTWKFLGGSWTSITSSRSPSSRWIAAIAYDAFDGYVIMYGGGIPSSSGGTTFSDTWKFLGGSWTNITPSSSPTPRSLASLAFDAADGYVILFGGEGNSGILGDTWKFLGGSWTNITSSSGPRPRAAASMAYDTADGYVVLFGGCCYGASTNQHLLSDTWKFVGSSWTNITSSNGPSPRDFASTAYDAADGYVILFGGSPASSSSSVVGDTWKFLGGLWTNITATGGPSSRGGASMTYDATDGYVILFGGGGAGSSVFGDTWKFLGGSWTNITPSSGLSPRVTSMAYDDSDGLVVAFGGGALSPTGSITALYGDTWKFLGGSWTNITSGNDPSPRILASFAYDAADRYVLLFGGEDNSGQLGDTWKFPSTSTAAGFDYRLSLSLSSSSIVGGSSISATLTATLTSGTAQQVTLMGSVSPFPTACQATIGNLYPCGTFGLSPSIITPTIVGATSVLGIDSTSTLPPGTYTLTITGSPGGASSSSALFILTVKASTSLSVTCSPSSIIVGRFTTCTATVAGSSPSGIVSFTASGSTGRFIPSSGECALLAGSCSVTFADTTPTTSTITASYPGDSKNHQNTGTFSMSVSKPNGVIAVGASSLTLNNGGVTANQGPITGVSVTITGSTAANGTPVGLTTQTLSAPSDGVPTASLGSPSYYDVMVRGISSGNAQVCISLSSPSPSLTMQYWTGTAWTTASSITVGGSTICGAIPVSALTGTNIALGNITPSPNRVLLYEIVAGLVAAIVIVGASLVLRRRGRERFQAALAAAPASQPPGAADANPAGPLPQQTLQPGFQRRSEEAERSRDSDALRARGKPAGLGRRLASIIRYESTWDRRKFWPYGSTALLLVFSLLFILILGLVPESVSSELRAWGWMYSILLLVGPTGFLAFLVGEASTSGTIGHERDKGTLANLLAQPLRRSEIFLGKYLAKLIWFLALSITISLVMIVSSRILLGPQIDLEWAPIIVLDLTLTFLFFAALAQFLSCFFRRSRTVFFIIVLMWLVATIPSGILAGLTLVSSVSTGSSPALVGWLLTFNPLSFAGMTLAGTVLYLAPLSILSALSSSAVAFGASNPIGLLGIGTIGFAEKSTIGLLFGTLGFLVLGWLAFRRIEITG